MKKPLYLFILSLFFVSQAASSVQGVILAAGKASRFKTGRTKLLEPICGTPMVVYPVRSLVGAGIEPILVLGYQAEEVQKTVEAAVEACFVVQSEQKGTGHALQCTKEMWDADNVLVLNGDMPLVTTENIVALVEQHQIDHAAVTFVTAYLANPEDTGYGRVIEVDGKIEIIEAKDFCGDVTEPCCINAGIYIFRRDFLEDFIDELQPSQVTGEVYITDLVKIAAQHNLSVQTLQVPLETIQGVNTLKELAGVQKIIQSQIVDYWMSEGVRFFDPEAVLVDSTVRIGAGSRIGYGAHLLGDTVIGPNSAIGSFVILMNVRTPEGVYIPSYKKFTKQAQVQLFLNPPAENDILNDLLEAGPPSLQ